MKNKHYDCIKIFSDIFTPFRVKCDDPHSHRDQLVKAFEDAVRAGNGAVSFQGRMIDEPIANIERIVLERARLAGVAAGP